MGKILFVDITSTGTKMEEAIGPGSIAAVLIEKGYTSNVMAYYESTIDYKEIVDYDPQVIGLPVHLSNVEGVVQFSAHVRTLLPRATIIIGGYGATYYAKELLEQVPEIDYVVKGEGELTFLELTDYICGKTEKQISDIAGIFYRYEDQVIENSNRKLIANLNTLPFCIRDVLDRKKLRVAYVESSRGCVGKCNFCSLQSFWNSMGIDECSWRGKGVERVIDEIEQISRKYGVTRFAFADASFENPGSNYKRVLNIAEEIIKRGLSITYYINIRAEFYKIADDTLMNKLIQSGLCGIFIGVESFNEEDMKVYGKIASLEENMRSIEYFQKFPIHVDIGVINLHPYSTFDSIYENAKYLKEFKYSSYLAHIRSLRLFRGTELYKRVEDDHLIIESKPFYDMYRYKFKDPRIDTLVNYLGEYMNKISKTFDIKEVLYFYATDFQDSLENMKRTFNNDQKEQEHEIVLQHATVIDTIMTELNEINTEWFIKLARLAEHRWIKEQADSIMNDMFSEQYINTKIKQLNSTKVSLLKSLLKIDRSYATFI